MSGHSKWSTIKRQKGLKDAQRGAIFTKLANAIALAARNGTDPDTNFALRLEIDRAKVANMPQANIQRAINRVADKNAADLQEALYEGYGPGGVAILVSVTTDNINRTYPEVRLAFSKHGGNIAEKGSVAFQFDHKGAIEVKQSVDDVLLMAIEAGADDVINESDATIIYTNNKMLAQVRDKLREMGVDIISAELVYVPRQLLKISDQETAGKIMRLVSALEEVDGVNDIYSNYDIDDDLMEKI